MLFFSSSSLFVAASAKCGSYSKSKWTVITHNSVCSFYMYKPHTCMCLCFLSTSAGGSTLEVGVMQEDTTIAGFRWLRFQLSRGFVAWDMKPDSKAVGK